MYHSWIFCRNLNLNVVEFIACNNFCNELLCNFHYSICVLILASYKLCSNLICAPTYAHCNLCSLKLMLQIVLIEAYAPNLCSLKLMLQIVLNLEIGTTAYYPPTCALTLSLLQLMLKFRIGASTCAQN